MSLHIIIIPAKNITKTPGNNCDQGASLKNTQPKIKDEGADKLVQVGTPVDIIMKPADDYVEAFVKDVNRAKVLRAKTVMIKANEFNSNDVKLADVYKVDEGSYIEQFLPKVLADRCTVMVVDKMGDTKGYITEKELAISLSKDGYNLK